MKLKIVDKNFEVQREDNDPEVSSVSALLHSICFNLKDMGVSCKVVNLERCPCIFGSTEGIYWLICEDVGGGAKNNFNQSKKVTLIFTGNDRVVDKIRKTIKGIS